jgi:hypothetical protein
VILSLSSVSSSFPLCFMHLRFMMLAFNFLKWLGLFACVGSRTTRYIMS